MGYVHYWYRPVVIDTEVFEGIAAQCAQACHRLGIPLAGFDGTGEATFSGNEISFNGVKNCGHPPSNIAIPWPAEDARGIAEPFVEDATAGVWFGGAILAKRMCDGDCSYETFWIPRVYEPREWEEPQNDLWFAFCKTAFRPYDLAVQVCLIIFKHHLGPQFRVLSDGTNEQWQEACEVCQHLLGFGSEFRLEE